MTDNEKFWLSQKQHIKFSNYYYNDGAFKNKKLCDYHSKCIQKQQDLGRILSPTERRKIYKSCK